jgi:hypothetical protein
MIPKSGNRFSGKITRQLSILAHLMPRRLGSGKRVAVAGSNARCLLTFYVDARSQELDTRRAFLSEA